MKRPLLALWLLVLAGCGSAPEPDALPIAEPGALASTDGGDWPQFLGLHRDGHSGETGLPADFADGPAQVWRKEIGPGFSGIAVASGTVYTAWNEGDEEVLVALDANDGEGPPGGDSEMLRHGLFRATRLAPDHPGLTRLKR